MNKQLEAVRKRLQMIMEGKLKPSIVITKESGMVSIDIRPKIYPGLAQ